MKKKIMQSILLGMIVCCLGCAAEERENIEDAGSERISSAEEPEEDISGDDEISEDETGTEEAVANNPEESETFAGYLDVVLDYHWDNYYDEVAILNAHYNTINLRSTEYPLLTDAVNNFNDAYTNEVQSIIEGLKEAGLAEYEEFGPDMFLGPYGYESEMFVSRGDSTALSVGAAVYRYSGGAHGSTWFECVNLDTQTGEEILLESVITDMESIPGILATEILEKYPDITYWTDTLEGTFQNYITPSDPDYAPIFVWTLGYDGVTFYFGSYEIGSYADGIQWVTLTYSEYPEIFDVSYFESVGTDYVMILPGWKNDTDLNGDGITDYISITKNYNTEYGFYESYNVQVNDVSYMQDTYFYELEAYLVKNGADHYLYVERTAENDYHSVCVFEITENSIAFVKEFDGGMECFTNASDFEVCRRVDLLSTYSVIVDCYVGEEGVPVENSERYEVGGDITLTSIIDIPAELVDENGNLLNTRYVFPAGTEFTFENTDGETFVETRTSDGQRCILYVEPGWPQTVNGFNAEEAFEMLFFAG